MAVNLGFGPLIGMNAPAVGMSQPRRSWQERLFDRFVPASSTSLVGVTGDDKKALVRQGLLQLAAGIQSSPNFGQGITQGLLGGVQGINQGLEDVQTRRLREQQLLQLQNNAMPTDFRSRDLSARAAGYQPGTKGYQDYFKRAGGELARAVTGARKNVEITGADGIKRPGVFDPSSATPWSVYDESTQTFRPLEAGETPSEAPAMTAPSFTPPASFAPPVQGLNPAQDFGSLTQQFGVQPSSVLRSPARNEAVGGVANSFHLTGQAADYPIPQQAKPAFIAQARSMGYQAIDEGDHVHIEPPGSPPRIPARAPAPAGLVVGRPPEQQAALTTAAEEQTKLGFLPTRLALEAEGAGLKVGKEAEAKVEAERIAKQQQRVIDAGQRAELLNQAEILLPNATSGGLAAKGAETAGFFGYSTPGAQATAGLNIIAAQLVQKVPRFEGPQSDKDVQSYKDAAGNLADATKPIATRLAALRAMRALDAKYGQSAPAQNLAAPQQSAPRRLKFNPATGRIE